MVPKPPYFSHRLEEGRAEMSTSNSETGTGERGAVCAELSPLSSILWEKQGDSSPHDLSLLQHPTVKRMMVTVTGSSVTHRSATWWVSACTLSRPHPAAVRHVQPGGGSGVPRDVQECIYHPGVYQAIHHHGIPGYTPPWVYQAIYTTMGIQAICTT